jgi:hypothetical protein
VLATLVAMVLSLFFYLLDSLHLATEAADEQVGSDIPPALDIVPVDK